MKAYRKIKVVKFGAKWCGPCKQFDKVLDKLEKLTVVQAKDGADHTFTVEVERVDVETSVGGLRGERWKVSALPTTFLVCGRFRRRILGAVGIREMRAVVARFAKKRLSMES